MDTPCKATYEPFDETRLRHLSEFPDPDRLYIKAITEANAAKIEYQIGVKMRAIIDAELSKFPDIAEETRNVAIGRVYHALIELFRTHIITQQR